MDANLLFVSLIFGSIGAGMIMYGRKAGRMVPLLSGVALVGIPYFIPNLIAMILVCSAITTLPWFLRHAA